MRIDGIGQITAETPGYDENVEAKSLVTKAWVEANSGSGGVSNLPISSTDGKVKIDSPDAGVYTLEVNYKTRMWATTQVGIEQDPASDTPLRIQVSKDSGGNAQGSSISWIKSDKDDANLYSGSIQWSEASANLSVIGQNNYGAAFVFDTINQNFIVHGQVQTDTITTKDAAANECSLTLDTNLNILCGIAGDSTPSVQRAQFRAAVDNSGVLVIGTPATGTTPSIPGISIHNDQNTATSQQQIRLVGAGGTTDYSYVGKTADAFSVVDNELIGGGAFYVGTDHGNAVFFSKDSELVFATGGLQTSKERLRITDNDLKAQTGYEPQTDDSLVTKSWVKTNGASGNLPISSTDDKVTLSDDGNGKFQIETGDPTTEPSSKAVRVEVDSIGHVAINGSESSAGSSSLPRTNTMLEVVSDTASPFPLILDGTQSTSEYEGRTGLRMYNGATNIYEYFIEQNTSAYGFTGGSNARSGILYGDTNADIYVVPNEYVRLTPEVRTNTITTEDATSGDPADGKNDGDKVIRLKGNQVQITDQAHDPGTGGYSLDIRDNRGMVRIRNDDVANGINDSAKIVLDVSNNNNATAIEFRTGNVVRSDIVKPKASGPMSWSQYCTNGSASGFEFRPAFGTVTEATLQVKSKQLHGKQF